MLSSQTVPTRSSVEPEILDQPLFPRDRQTLSLHTYRPSAAPTHNLQPTPFPLDPTPGAHYPSIAHFSHNALPWKVKAGDYLEIRKVQRPTVKKIAGPGKWGMPPSAAENKTGGEALRGLSKKPGRESFFCRVSEDMPNIPINQIQLPESVASSFRFQARGEVEVIRVSLLTTHLVHDVSHARYRSQKKLMPISLSYGSPNTSDVRICGVWLCHWKVKQSTPARNYL